MGRMRLRLSIFLGLACLFVSAFPLSSRAYTSEANKKKHVWKTEGIVLYASPSFDAEPISQIAYGESLTIERTLEDEAVEAIIYQHREEDSISDEYLKEYRLPSSWLQVKHNGLSGYVIDTYLSALFPPLDARYVGFIVEDYVKSLSTITFQQYEDQTAEFCARNTWYLENGIQFTNIDFGPCEQCGHMQLQLYLPSIDKKEATMIAFQFFNLYGLFSADNTTLVKKDGKAVELEGFTEYGQAFVMRIIEQGDGVLLIEDAYM